MKLIASPHFFLLKDCDSSPSHGHGVMPMLTNARIFIYWKAKSGRAFLVLADLTDLADLLIAKNSNVHQIKP